MEEKMRKSKRLILCILFFALIAAVTGCGKGFDIRGTLEETRRIVIPEADRLYPVKTGYFTMNWNDGSLRLLGHDGALKDKYFREGNGPGELNKGRADIIGTFDEKAFVGALDRSVVLVFSLENEKIRFLDEYPVDEGALRGGAVSKDGTMWLSLRRGPYQLLSMTAAGEVTGRYLPTENQSGRRNPENMIRSMAWIHCEGDKVFSIGYMSYDLQFYQWDAEALSLLNETKPDPLFVEKNYELKSSGRRFDMQGKPGIQGYAVSGETLYLKLLTDEKTGDKEKKLIHALALNGENRGLWEYQLKEKGTINRLAGCSHEGEILAYLEKDDESDEETLVFLRPLQSGK